MKQGLVQSGCTKSKRTVILSGWPYTNPLGLGGRQLGPFLVPLTPIEGDQVRQSRNFICWSRYGKGERPLLRRGWRRETFKGWVCHQNCGKGWRLPEIAGACAVLCTRQALIVPSKAQVPHLSGGLSVVRRQRKLSNPLCLVCAGAAVVVRLEPVQGGWLSPSWPCLAAAVSAVWLLWRLP